jgi:predicted NBD/HSP70 family sugar kinase
MNRNDLGRLVVGIDLGGTKVRAGLASLEGRLLTETVEPTRTGPELVAQLAAMVERLGVQAKGRVAATAVGGAGVPDPGGANFSMAPNLGDLRAFNLAGDLRDRLGHPVVLENDVNVAALGELHAGAGLEADSFAFVSVGTGIGVGLVLDRRLWPGAKGGAGEVGYLPLGADPLDPANQRRGPLEEMVAGDALARRYETATGSSPVTAVDVFDRALDGDEAAVWAIDTEAQWLATALAAVDSVVDPGLFVLGGGIGSRPELLEPLRHWLRLLGRPSLQVRPSALGAKAPILGAVRLAIDAVHNNQERDAS